MITPNLIWANGANNTDVIKPDNDKMFEGWTYEDQPSYQEWNWFTRLFTQYFAYINEQTIPEYRNRYTYYATSLLKHNGTIYYSVCEHEGDTPSWDNRKYNSPEILRGVQNVFVDFPEDNQVLFFNIDTWYNTHITTYPLNTYTTLTKSDKYKQLPGYSDKDGSGSYEGTELKPYDYFLTQENGIFSSMSLKDILKLKNVEINQNEVSFSVKETKKGKELIIK